MRTLYSWRPAVMTSWCSRTGPVALSGPDRLLSGLVETTS